MTKLNDAALSLRHSITRDLNDLTSKLPQFVLINGLFTENVEKIVESIGNAIGLATVLLLILSDTTGHFSLSNLALANIGALYERVRDHVIDINEHFRPRFLTIVTAYTTRLALLTQEHDEAPTPELKEQASEKIEALDSRFAKNLPPSPDIVLDQIIAEVRKSVNESMSLRSRKPNPTTTPTEPTKPITTAEPTVATQSTTPAERTEPITPTKSTEPTTPVKSTEPTTRKLPRVWIKKSTTPPRELAAGFQRGRKMIARPGESTESDTSAESDAEVESPKVIRYIHYIVLSFNFLFLS